MGAQILWEVMGRLYGDAYKDLWVRGPDIGNNTTYDRGSAAGA